jgi:DNA repair photolyase
MENILEAAHVAGATQAGYVLMRLPYEVKDLFRDWLLQHYPLKAAHVMSRVHSMRQGKDNDPNFGSRMSGQGELAKLLAVRFDKTCKRLGLNVNRRALDTSQFKPPRRAGQSELF